MSGFWEKNLWILPTVLAIGIIALLLIAGCADGGCKTDLGSDPNNCGSCGHVCGSLAFCVSGKCVEQTAIGWTGAWMLKFINSGLPESQLNLVQDGNAVTGTYDWHYGRIAGTVQGDRLIGTWTETDPDNHIETKGPFEYVKAGNGMTFSGWYMIEPFDSYEWEKMKNGPPYASGSRVIGPYTWTGTWDLSPGGSPQGPFDTPMKLEQSDNSVTGTFEIQDGTITGSVQGGRLVGRWEEVDVNGMKFGDSIELVLIDGGTFFYGWMDDTQTHTQSWEDLKAQAPIWYGKRVSG